MRPTLRRRGPVSMADPSEPAGASPVLVVGEALIDIVTDEAGGATESVGGSPANVALGLARLGVPARLRTALAHDDRGQRIASHLTQSGVNVDPASFTLSRTSTATACLSARGDASYDFDIDWRIEGSINLRGATTVHVGSIACFVEPGATVVRDAIGSWPRDVRLTFDPNIRPALVADRVWARTVTEGIASRSDVVKLSDEDADWLYPLTTVDEVLDRLLALGARIVALSCGAKGAVLASKEARVTVQSRAVSVKDTVGAGDTFMAALIASLVQGRLDGEESSLRYAGTEAAAAAAITVGRVGADLPTRADLEMELAGARSLQASVSD